jgi:hypothetical protein
MQGDIAVAQELPIESPHKYGRFDDDVTDLAVGLNGGKPLPSNSGHNSLAVDHVPDDNEVDEDFFGTLRDTSKKYGA